MLGKWKKRYLTLDPNSKRLYYLEKKTDPLNIAKGFIELLYAIEVRTSEKYARQFTIQIPGREYCFETLEGKGNELISGSEKQQNVM